MKLNVNTSVLKKMPPISHNFYDIPTKNKIPCDYYAAIPYGKKYIIWFTHHNNENVAIFIEYNKKSDKKFNSCFITPLCFNKDLSSNTILYGTLTNNKYYCIEDLYYYKNKYVYNFSNLDKLDLIERIFNNDIKNTLMLKHSINIFIPLLNVSNKQLNTEIAALPYKIYCIHGKYFNNKKTYKFNVDKNTKIYKKYWVCANTTNDIYELYCDKDKTDFIDYAYVPNYKCSKFLNNIFRNIIENENLDAIEESDDDNDGENYIMHGIIKLMKCEFDTVFKKWIPISCI